MAIVNFQRAHDMTSPNVWFGTVTEMTANYLSTVGGDLTSTYYGVLKYKNGVVSGGTVTGYSQYYQGDIDYYFYNASLNAAKVSKYVHAGSAEQLQAYALSGNDTVYGSEYADKLLGYKGNDFIQSNAGDDYINGGVGKDVMKGGTGSDYYVVDNKNDIVIEYDGEGVDTISSTVTFDLAAKANDVEALSLEGGKKLNGYGNLLDNQLTGNTGANILDGRDGNDVIDGNAGKDIILGGKGSDNLTGGLGADIFKWSLADIGSDTDTITDFNTAEKDKLDLRDLLVGESKKDMTDLLSYIDISHQGDDKIISISSHGSFANGKLDANAIDQTIVLHDFNHAQIATFSTEEQLLKHLVTQKIILVD